ncbi:MAG TPA: SUF system NifU family Fe-S cluster assembly protein [Acidimicrobiaceae bacterium]|nr:SUF system NifU family Fe-S cluster assembly protein [Acidimicrobiaceae bacterium]HCB36928.1 SUF system NifU family Fe-S cluster assembly protein [Acidimicrobiaceae bacterium]
MAGLEDLYREIILDHYRSPRRRGELACPPAHRSEGFNPLCGDEVVLTFEVRDGAVADVAVGGQGCAISQASASMMSEAVVGKSTADVRRLSDRFKAMMGIDGAPDPAPDPADTAPADAAPSPTDPLSLGDLEALRGVVKFPVRIKCATLAWNALLSGLDELDAAAAPA